MHTLHFYHNHLSSHPLQPIHLMRPAFSSTFPLKLEQALQSFSLQNPHSPFEKGGRGEGATCPQKTPVICTQHWCYHPVSPQ